MSSRCSCGRYWRQCQGDDKHDDLVLEQYERNQAQIAAGRWLGFEGARIAYEAEGILRERASTATIPECPGKRGKRVLRSQR